MISVLDADKQPQPAARCISFRLITALLAGFVIVATVFFLEIGRWLVIEDALEKAQAIVILSGKLPVRAIEAAQLYRAGYSTQIWLTRTKEPAASLQPMHIAYIGEDFYNAQVLMHEGVPESAIHVLDAPIVNTADELRAVAAELSRQNGSTVIIVTTKAHTRRVKTLWRSISHQRSRAIVRAAREDSFRPDIWWRTSGDALDVVREVLGLLNAWAGLPLHGST